LSSNELPPPPPGWKANKKKKTKPTETKKAPDTAGQKISAYLLAGLGWLICGLGLGLNKLGLWLRHWKREMNQEKKP
jgi:hypothetical protein